MEPFLKLLLEAYQKGGDFLALLIALLLIIFQIVKYFKDKRRCCDVIQPNFIAIDSAITGLVSKVKDIERSLEGISTDIISKLKESIPSQVKLLLDSDINQIKNYNTLLTSLEDNIVGVIEKEVKNIRDIDGDFRDYITESSSRMLSTMNKMSEDINIMSREIHGMIERDRIDKDRVLYLTTRMEDLKTNLATLQTLLSITLGNKSGAGF